MSRLPVTQQLIRRRAPLGIASLVVIGLYFVYQWIVRSGVIAPLSAQDSFAVLSRIVNFTFLLAITTVTLSLISYALPKILPANLIAPLDAEKSATLLTRVADLGFALAVTATVFGAASYTLPRVLPASFWEPASRIEYGVAIARMIDPYEQGGMAEVLDKIEIYPGFPYFSRKSDHPSYWPLRVSQDREMLYQQYGAFMEKFPVRELLAARGSETGSSVKLLGRADSQERGTTEAIVQLRMWFNETRKDGAEALERALGPEGAAELIRIEQQRAKLREGFPNRYGLIRIRNTGKRDARNVTIEFDLFGLPYDVAINADPEKVRNAAYDRAKKRIEIANVLPGSQVDIRLWYQYYSVENRVFPDEQDFILELTQGLIINNIAVSDGNARFNGALVKDFSAYENLYVGAAAKKDDYSAELAAYFKEKNARVEEDMKKYDKEHPSFSNVSSEWLMKSQRPDESVNSIWVSFLSAAGKHYTAVHVFRQNDPYILLSSTDKDRSDFARVEAQVARAYGGKPDNDLSDRGDDICDVIRVADGFTQTGVAKAADGFFKSEFKQVVIDAVHY